jgi:hypothetical protein
MDTSTIGKWAWLIALVVWVVVSALAGLGVNLNLPTVVGDIAGLLAFVGGLLYISGMKDITGFLIATAALGWFTNGAGGLFVSQLGGLVSGILGGAYLAAAAAAAGALVMVVYNWIMAAMK